MSGCSGPAGPRLSPWPRPSSSPCWPRPQGSRARCCCCRSRSACWARRVPPSPPPTCSTTWWPPPERCTATGAGPDRRGPGRAAHRRDAAGWSPDRSSGSSPAQPAGVRPGGRRGPAPARDRAGPDQAPGRRPRSARRHQPAGPSPQRRPAARAGGDPPAGAGPAAAAVGCVGGIYGIGGGSILAPVLTGTGRPPSEVAPAALASTFVTSVAGVVTFTVLSWHQHGPVAPTGPPASRSGPAGSRAPTPGRGPAPAARGLIRRLIGILARHRVPLPVGRLACGLGQQSTRVSCTSLPSGVPGQPALVVRIPVEDMQLALVPGEDQVGAGPGDLRRSLVV